MLKIQRENILDHQIFTHSPKVETDSDWLFDKIR